MTKLRFTALFLLLTMVHICGQLRPTVNASILLKSTYPEVDKSIQLEVGYEFEQIMFWHAALYSAIALCGVWLTLEGVDKAFYVCGNGLLLGSLKQLLPKKFHAQRSSYAWLLLLPWLLTFSISSFMKYIQLALVLRHFCESYLNVLMLYWRVQLLFLRNNLSCSANYLSEMTGLLNSIQTPQMDFIAVAMELLD